MFWTNDLEKKKTKRYALFGEFTLRRMVVSYRRFGTTYRSNFQGSSSPRRNTHYTRYVSVHFRVLKILKKKRTPSVHFRPSYQTARNGYEQTYPSSHAKSTIALASFRLSREKKCLFDSLNVCLCSRRTFKRVFTHLLKQNSTRTGLSGICVLCTSWGVYGKLSSP